MKHNFLRRLSALALAWVMAASLCVTPAWAEGDFTVAINKTELELTVGATETLTLTRSNEPTGATVFEEHWTCSPSGIIEVSNGGEVKAIAPGEATVSVTVDAKDDNSALLASSNESTCKVTVKSAGGLTPVDPSLFAISSELVILPQSANPYPLIASGVSENMYVKWMASGGVQVNGKGSDITTVEVGKGISSVSITATSSAAPGIVKVQVYRDKQATLSPYTREITCYVYGGGRTPIVIPDSLSAITEGQPAQTVTFAYDSSVGTYPKVREILERPGSVNFEEVPADFVDITPSTSTSGYRVAITGNEAITGSIIVTLPGGFSKPVSLTVNSAPDTVAVNRVELNPNILQMTAGDTYDALKTVVYPENATKKEVKWDTSNAAVATVNDGKVEAIAAGTATITATVGGKSGTCTVRVQEAPSSFELDTTSMVLDIQRGGVSRKTIKPELFGENSTRVSVKWTTSNSAVADFNGQSTRTTNRNAQVTIAGHKTGTARITATATFSDRTGKVTATKTAYCNVTVIDEKSVLVTDITLSEDTHTMPADGTFNLSVKAFTPASAPAKEVEWESSDSTIAEVDPKSGNITTVTAHEKGQVAITAREVHSGAYKSCRVTVTPIAETITLSGFNYDSNTTGTNKYTYTFRNSGNDYINVRANLGPTGAADPIHWVSKNPAVATVSNTTSAQAAVTAVGAGRTTITAVPMDPAGKDRVLESGPAEITVEVSGVTIVNDDAAAITSLTLMEGQRRQIESRSWGAADNGDNSVEWNSSDPSVVTVNPKSSATTTLSARGKGTATISARKGSFIATCTVTVTEDTAGVISVSTTPGTAYQFSSLASSISSACQTKTGAGLSYITNLSVSSTDQGILHDQHHSSADTGAGVGIQDRYYAGTAPQGQRSLSDLSFVPRNDFSGVAEINYTAWSTNNKSVNGVIRVTVNGTGDVMYASGEGAPVTFQADDFNRYHPNFKSVSFTPPLDSRGVLYYNYTSASQPGTKVTASDSYNRTGTPSVDRVTFVPAAGFSGTVSISYRGTDNGGRSFTGTVTINVSAASNAGSTADISYPLREDSWVTFTPADFNAASQRTLGEALSYVRFTPPPSSDGTLFYNYRGFSSFDSMVNDTTSYYYSGTPALSGVSFVPTTTTPGQVDVAYTGYTVKGNTFTGIIHIGQSSTTQPANDLRYSVVVGQTINLSASAINSACVAATGASLSYIQFTQLPTVSQGTLRYTRGSSSTRYNVSTSTRFFYTGTSTTTELIGNVFFQAGTTVGTVTIPFTGYNTNGVSFTDEITIQVTPPTTTYSGTTASPLRLSASQISSAVSGALSGTLSYITFTSLPSTTAGHLYQGYSGVGTGTQVNTGTRYYASGTPSIDQISFVPRGRYNGQVTIGYTATNTSGQSTTGQVVFNISSTGNSSYFNDMYGHTWAGPSVDYLYQNNVTNGVTSTQFAPNQRINRCDFVLMLCRAFKLSGGSGYSFPDVPTDSYFASAVATAKQLGIVNGDDRGRFQPYGQVTRQDAMVMTYNALRAAGWSVGSASTSVLNQFPDGNSVSSYARTAVSSLVQMGAVTGDNGRLLPHNSITRAEAAVILHFVMTM